MRYGCVPERRRARPGCAFSCAAVPAEPARGAFGVIPPDGLAQLTGGLAFDDGERVMHGGGKPFAVTKIDLVVIFPVPAKIIKDRLAVAIEHRAASLASSYRHYRRW